MFFDVKHHYLLRYLFLMCIILACALSADPTSTNVAQPSAVVTFVTGHSIEVHRLSTYGGTTDPLKSAMRQASNSSSRAASRLGFLCRIFLSSSSRRCGKAINSEMLARSVSKLSPATDTRSRACLNSGRRYA